MVHCVCSEKEPGFRRVRKEMHRRQIRQDESARDKKRQEASPPPSTPSHPSNNVGFLYRAVYLSVCNIAELAFAKTRRHIGISMSTRHAGISMSIRHISISMSIRHAGGWIESFRNSFMLCTVESRKKQKINHVSVGGRWYELRGQQRTQDFLRWQFAQLSFY